MTRQNKPLLPDSYFGDEKLPHTKDRSSVVKKDIKSHAEYDWDSRERKFRYGHDDNPTFEMLAETYRESTSIFQREAILYEIAERGMRGNGETRKQAGIFLLEIAQRRHRIGVEQCCEINDLAYWLFIRFVLTKINKKEEIYMEYHTAILEFFGSKDQHRFLNGVMIYEQQFSAHQQRKAIREFLQKAQFSDRGGYTLNQRGYQLWCHAVANTGHCDLFMHDLKYHMPWYVIYSLFTGGHVQVGMKHGYLESSLWKTMPALNEARKQLREDSDQRAKLSLDCAKLFCKCGSLSSSNRRNTTLLYLTAWLFKNLNLVDVEVRL
jgi:hypothetical protein